MGIRGSEVGVEADRGLATLFMLALTITLPLSAVQVAPGQELGGDTISGGSPTAPTALTVPSVELVRGFEASIAPFTPSDLSGSTSVTSTTHHGTLSFRTSLNRTVAAGGDHTCAILDDGSVSCWGSNQYGQLGEGRGWVTKRHRRVRRLA